MPNRRIDPRRIKIHRPYTVDEAAKVLGTHKNTVRQWIKQGLSTAGERRPTLLRGNDIRAFLENRNAKRKHRLASGEFYCLKCRAPKPSYGGVADYVPTSPTLGNMKGLCPDCGTIMNRRTSLAKLDRVKGKLEVTIFAGSATPKRDERPSLNCDFDQGSRTMKKAHAPNERIKREYFTYLKEAKGRSEASLDAVAKALNRFETYTRFRDFKLFHIEQAKGFKAHLAEQTNARTGKPLSAATLYSTLGALKAFFQWLAGRPGYKSRIGYADAEYFNLTEKEARIATAHREQRAPTIDMIRNVLETMPARTDIERRDSAIIAFALLTCARVGAIASFKLKHIDVVAGKVDQDAREVKTKRSKTFTTCFFPVGDDIRNNVVDWVNYLRMEKLWGNDDPLFPATEMGTGTDLRFEVIGLARKHWSGTASVRRIFKDAFVEAGLPYANPHSFRNTLMQLGYDLRLSHEELKAWSQNFGHDNILTTMCSYGEVPLHRQAEIMRDLAKPRHTKGNNNEIAQRIAELAAQLQA
jgi:integrase/recombinase XerD